MKHTAWLMLLVTAAVALAAYLANSPQTGQEAVAAPPLSLEGFLDEKLPEAPTGDDGIKADNFACHVCHGNYREEPFAVTHAKADISCIDCHGVSHAHRDDEDNIIPPDVMYPPEEIAKKCMKCHKKHDAPAKEVIARWLKRCSDKKDPGKLVCTDCHGQHRLKLRLVRWDKKTGKLITGKKPAAQAAPTTNSGGL